MKRKQLLRLACVLLAGLSFARAQLQLTTITSTSLKMSGVVIPAGTATFTAVNTLGAAIPFVTGGGGLNAPTAFSCTITAGAITGTCQIPDACLTTPANVLYTAQIMNTQTGRAFTMAKIPGICGATWALDAYAPPASTTNVQPVQMSYGTLPPPNPCVNSSLYIRNFSGGQLYICVASVPVLVTGGGGGGSITWLGAWSSSTAYVFSDAVSYQGSSYIALASSTNVTPPSNPSDWALLAQVGATGATGSTGATGATGSAGAAATIAAGTTITLSPGASATVSNSGSSSAAVFNFGIPAGVAGATGATGSTGPAGPTIYPGAGIAVSPGSSGPWSPSLTAPAGTIVGTTDTQTLTNKTLDGVSPATMAMVDPTSSIQTQLNGKPGTASAINTLLQASTGCTTATYLYNPSTGTCLAPSGASMVYPGAGIPNSTGSAWGASFTAPAGTIVGTTDTQTLTNKTLDGVTPATMAMVDPTSSIQTQLNAKPGYPGAGIPNSTGSAWGSSFTAPSGTIVGTSDTQTLTNKSIALSEITPGSAPSGTYDFSGSTILKLPSAAAFAAAANGSVGYDSTNLNWHIYANAVDNFVVVFPVASPPTSGNCAKFLKSTNTWTLADSGVTNCAQVYPGAGIPNSTGSAWGASFTAPAGVIVGTTDTQTLTNKTLDGVSPATMAMVDPTSSIQTQLNAKAPVVSPSFTTPSLGAATASTINKVAITAPATGSTLTLADGSTLTLNGAFNTQFSASANATFTLPGASDTLAGLTATQTITNKTLDGVSPATMANVDPTSSVQTQLNAKAPLASPSFTTPSLGAATATSLLATGIVDGQVPITINATASFTFGGTYQSGYVISNDGSTAVTGTLPTAAAGKQYCVRNIAAATSTLKILTSATGQFIDNAGGYTATGGYVISGGALGDAACVVAIDATHWELYIQSGTWTTH